MLRSSTHRLTTTALSALVIGALSTTAAAPAGATGADATRGSSSEIAAVNDSPLGEGVAAKEARTLKIKGVQKGQRFFLKGRISPHKRFKIVVQRKVCNTNNDCQQKYRTYKKLKTTKKGTFQLRIAGPQGRAKRVYYRAYAPPNKKYSVAKSDKAIYVYKI